MQILSYHVIPAPVFTTELFTGDELPTLADPHTIKVRLLAIMQHCLHRLLRSTSQQRAPHAAARPPAPRPSAAAGRDQAPLLPGRAGRRLWHHGSGVGLRSARRLLPRWGASLSVDAL